MPQRMYRNIFTDTNFLKAFLIDFEHFGSNTDLCMKKHNRELSILIWKYYKEALKNNILGYYLPLWLYSFIFAPSIERTWQP